MNAALTVADTAAGATVSSLPEALAVLPRLPRDEGGPVFAEPWQAQAFALAVKLSEQGHFTWKEWAAALADQLQAADARGKPDDGSRYYEHWLAALERLVTAKGLTDPSALAARKTAWTSAYRITPHGMPVVLPQAHSRGDARWLLLGLGSAAASYWLVPAGRQFFGGSYARFVASAGLGTLLGMRHALEPDHLAALSTLLTGERNVRKAAWLGVYWGIGHTLTLLAAGTLLVIFRADMPAMASDALACAVVLLLVVFGFRAIYLSARQTRAGRPRSHVHGAPPASASISTWTLAGRPLLVGAVHGLAGSGALTALVMATIPSVGARLIYLLLFGVGSTLGMAALSGLMGWPIACVGTHGTVARSLSLAVGCISIMLGLYWGYPLITRLL
jgi:nitrile hydratase accessory protein